MAVWIKRDIKKEKAKCFYQKITLTVEKNVDNEVKRACREFLEWCEEEYIFPKKLVIVLKESDLIKAKDGEYVSATCFLPYDLQETPYAKISTGDYGESSKRYGKDNALAGILTSIAHEITHYFQWLNGIELMNEKMEKQAERCARYVVGKYACTREHP